MNDYSKAWKLRNPERVREKRRRYSARPEIKERIRGWAKESYQRNRAAIRERENAKRLGHPEKTLLVKAKERARARDMPCTITERDIVIPTHCPLLGIELRRNVGATGANSPTLDRIEESGGYEPGNVWVISYRANRIKNDATLEELRAIVAGLATRLGR
jgi:hypothetical protein